MWSRVAHLTDAQLAHFTMEHDLVEVRTGPTCESFSRLLPLLLTISSLAYGTIIFGKIQIHDFKDDKGEGFLHIRFVSFLSSSFLQPVDRGCSRIHDPPDRVSYS